MQDDELYDIEVRLLLDALWLAYGYDFRDYSPPSLRRRIRQLPQAVGCGNVAEIIPRLLRDAALVPQLVHRISVPVSELFRDPGAFRAVVQVVLPLLASHPHINVWHAGCATGEEVYSLAILLEEAGLYDRCQIYATDFDEVSLRAAEAGVYSPEALRAAHKRYRDAGGRNSLSDYFHVRYGLAKAHDELRRNILFAQHNLVSDGVFCEAHLIVCRNVFIYFNAGLQCRVQKLFADTLVGGGFLWLGARESLASSSIRRSFVDADADQRLFRYHPPVSAIERAPDRVAWDHGSRGGVGYAGRRLAGGS